MTTNVSTSTVRMLPPERYLDMLSDMPLVSVDLIVRRASDQAVLVGQRRNRPALGSWFVPGGAIRKTERLAQAIERVCRTELGHVLPTPAWTPLGTFEHHYDDNFLGRDGISTHYVVLAHTAIWPDELGDPCGDDQHEHFIWMQVDDLLHNPDVHPYTRAYFDGGALTRSLA